MHHPHDHHVHPDDPSQPLGSRVMRAFHRIAHSNRQLMLRRMGEHGSHPAQGVCLRELSRNDGITQRDLAELLGIARPTVTVMLQKMEKAGLIERHTDEADQRFTRIFLTDAGRRLHDDMRRMFDDLTDDVIGRMSEEDLEELVRLLGVVHENIQAAIARGGASAANARVEE